MSAVRSINRGARVIASAVIACSMLAPFLSLASTTVATKGTTTIVTLTSNKDIVSVGATYRYVLSVRQDTTNFAKMNVSLSLPSQVELVTPDNGGRFIGGQVFWDDVDLIKGEPKMLSVSVKLQSNISDKTQLVATAHADGVSVSDTVTVTKANSAQLFSASISDGEITVVPGTMSTYTIKVENKADFAQRVDVVAYAPDLSSVETADADAVITWPTIAWKDVTFAPHQQRTYHFTTTFRNRMPLYTSAVATVRVGAVLATDTTVVHLPKNPSDRYPFMREETVPTKPTLPTGRSILFQKSADTAEVVAGGVIHYTLVVQNLSDSPIKNAVITDRFDPTKISFEYGDGAIDMGNGQVQWKLSIIPAGDTWRKTYTMRVSSHLRNGDQVVNIATISGPDGALGTMSDRVSIVQTNVVAELPQTGSAFDLLFLLIAMPLAAAGAFSQKALKLS